MSFTVYDYRTDIRNVLVTPHIRSRFLRMEVGQVNGYHSHDLGHEIFLILQGRAEFEIDGQTQELGPGQMCIALADEGHLVRNVGDEPVIMYLSVTPHIQPTHTQWSEDGNKKPPMFRGSTEYNQEPDKRGTEELVDLHLQATKALSQAVESSTKIQEDLAGELKEAIDSGEVEAANRARDTMWEAVYYVYKSLYDQAETWNSLTARTVEET